MNVRNDFSRLLLRPPRASHGLTVLVQVMCAPLRLQVTVVSLPSISIHMVTIVILLSTYCSVYDHGSDSLASTCVIVGGSCLVQINQAVTPNNNTTGTQYTHLPASVMGHRPGCHDCIHVFACDIAKHLSALFHREYLLYIGRYFGGHMVHDSFSQFSF